jgi:hypothetical protein
MKIKFDIKYRQIIENGKYKVVLYDDTPVTIEKWNLKGSYPVLAVLPTSISVFDGENSWVEERPFIYTKDGRCADKCPSSIYYQLYIDTGDELTASERMLYNLVNDHVYNRDSIDEDEVREWMKEIFLPALIEDSRNMGDYFKMNDSEYFNLKRIEEVDDGV